ncbi:MAG TPA: PAS domain S-box protein [Nitrospira sp.]|nr:PAS domain S-box protein [Nitrospira sp.]
MSERAIFEKELLRAAAESRESRAATLNLLEDTLEARRQAEKAVEALRDTQAALLRAQQAAHAGLWEIDLASRKMTWSQAYYELFGLPLSEEPCLESWRRRVHPDDLADAQKQIRRSLEQPGPHSFQFRIVRPDGTVRWVQRQGDVMCDEEGRPVHISGITFDITERKQAEDALTASEERYRVTFDNAAVGMAHVGLDGRWLRVNDTLCRITGYSREELLATTVSDITFPDDVGPTMSLMRRLISGELSTYTLEKRYRRKDGSSAWVNVSVSLKHDAEGRPQYLIGVVSDITDRKHAEEERLRSEARFKLLAENAALLLRSDLPQRLVDRLCRNVMEFLDCQVFFNYLLDTSTGRLRLNAWSGIPDETAHRVEWLDAGSAVCGCAVLNETRIVLEDIGRTAHPGTDLVRSMGIQACAGHPLIAQGKMIGTLSFGTTSRSSFSAEDLSLIEAVSDQVAIALQRQYNEEALRESERRLQQWSEQLEERVTERTQELVQTHQRLRGLATELNLTEQRERKKLAAVLHDHLAQLLVLCRLKLSQMKRTAEFTASTHELIKQTEEVLAEALTFTRTLVADLTPPVLHDLGLREGLKWLADYMRRFDMTVTLAFDEAAPWKLPEEQAVLLFQCVRELLMNSYKHAETKATSVSLAYREHVLSIQVRDRGKGFAAAAAADSIPSTKFGLFSIRERMAALDGSFDIESEPGKGTTATLTLPLAPRTAGDESRVTGDKSKHIQVNQEIPIVRFGGTSPVTRHMSPSPIRVLLVDDHAMVRQGLRSVLDSYADVEVVGEAADGEEAIAAVAKWRPTVVVMDINMPKLNGIEATARIKTRYPEVVVIGLSVQSGREPKEAMLQAGAAMLLTKEAAVERLYDSIRLELQAR